MSELQLDNSSHWFYYLLRLFERFIEIRECSDNLPRIRALSKRDQPKRKPHRNHNKKSEKRNINFQNTQRRRRKKK